MVHIIPMTIKTVFLIESHISIASMLQLCQHIEFSLIHS